MVVVTHLKVTHLDVDVVLIIGLEKAFDMFALFLHVLRLCQIA